MSVTLPDGLDALVTAISRASASTEELPYLSKAEAGRMLMASGAEAFAEGDLELHSPRLADEVDVEALREFIPGHLLAKHLYYDERDRNWPANMRGGFETRVRERLEERFEKGWSPEAAAEVAESYIREAHIFFMVIEDDPEGYEHAVEYVHDRLDDYADRYETTTWSFEEDWLGGYEGVVSGREQEVVADSAMTMVEDILDRLESRYSGEAVLSPDDVVRAVAKKYGVDEERVWSLVRAIRGDGDAALPQGMSIPQLEEVEADD